MSTADVSVIVAAYQAAGTIGRALGSVAGQTLRPSEVVVVDDGSSDGTADTAESLAGALEGIRLRVVRGAENRGAGWARNRAVEESTQPILAFLDADDEWRPEKLARSMAHLAAADYALVAHDYVAGDGPDAPHVRCAERFRRGADPFVELYRRGYLSTSTVVARRDAVLAAGGFDPGLRNAQDFDLWLAMTRAPATRFLVFDEPLMRYHVTPGSIMSHTRRRLHCGVAIAIRYFPDLRRRPGSALASLWFRVVALHIEAIYAYIARRDAAGSVVCAIALPARLISATAACLLGRSAGREHYIQSAPGGGET